MAQLVKTLTDTAIASIKTVGDLAVASAKSIGDLDNTAGGGGGGTDWTADATLKGLYLFNSSPGINQDSSGKGNHVDDAVAAEAPAAAAGDKIEGDQAADFETSGNDDGLVLSYTNASADFPCNGTGDGEVTFAGWLKPESIPSTGYIFGINAGVQRMTLGTGGVITIIFDGSSAATHTSTATLSAGTWYFVAAVYSDSANEIRCYIRAQGAGAFTIETTAANIGTLDDATGGLFTLGCRLDNIVNNCFDGLMDAWAVFNGKAFSQAELEGVFTNGWDGNGW
jgi:hypothetical protein